MKHTIALSLFSLLFFSNKSLMAINNADPKTVKIGENIAYEEYVEYQEFKIKVVRVGKPELPKILFIHGSPGDWKAWKNMMKDSTLLSRYCMLSLDRPGYGKTTIPAQKALKVHAQVAALVIKHYRKNNELFVVAGHSYGGGVAAQLLLDFPQMVLKAVLVSPTLSAKHQPLRWYNKVGRWPFIRSVIPKSMKASNFEMIPLADNLALLDNRWKEISKEVIVIHGKKDILVPFGTVDYFRSKVDNATFIIEDKMNHFVPWSHPQLIIDALL